MKGKIFAVVFLSALLMSPQVKAQFALKTNLLYWATTTPNIGAELAVSDKSTIQAFYGLNPWKATSGKSIRHWVLQPEYRYWFCGVFDGWFIGAHAMGGQFNAGNVKLPLGILSQLEDHRYEGWYVGGGVTAGYQWVLSKHWNVEASLGIGYDYIKYKKFVCGDCGEKLKRDHSHYVGPTKAAVSLLYLF